LYVSIKVSRKKSCQFSSFVFIF